MYTVLLNTIRDRFNDNNNGIIVNFKMVNATDFNELNRAVSFATKLMSTAMFGETVYIIQDKQRTIRTYMK